MKTPPVSNHLCQLLVSALLASAMILSCSAPVPHPTGAAYEYESAKEMFKKGRFDRTIEFADGPANAAPPNAFTDRARILELVVYSGQMNGYKELIDAYRKGADATKNTRFKAEYERQRHDSLQYASRLGLGLGDVAHRMAEGTILAKEYSLEAPYPTTEGPLSLPQLAKVIEGGWIEPEEQEAVTKEAQIKGIDDALADLVGGDRSKARTALSAGPVKLEGAEVGLYLAKQLLTAASLFDRKHGRDSMKLRTLCGEADETVKATLALLKEAPNKDQEKSARKLQEEIKSTLKNL